MSEETHAQSFRLAPMSPLIRTLTLLLLALPAAFFIAPPLGARLSTAPVLFIGAIYLWIWLRFRPTRFVVRRRALQVTWPLKRRQIPLSEISSVRILDRAELKREIGWGMRVVAGGLFGGFGWLWTQRRGIVQMYVSRTDRFVWIERAGACPWLITPEGPAELAAALSATGGSTRPTTTTGTGWSFPSD